VKNGLWRQPGDCVFGWLDYRAENPNKNREKTSEFAVARENPGFLCTRMSTLSTKSAELMKLLKTLCLFDKLLFFIYFVVVQILINLTEDSTKQAFFAFTSKLSTDLSTDSVDNKTH
jgi:hypothetical protein